MVFHTQTTGPATDSPIHLVHRRVCVPKSFPTAAASVMCLASDLRNPSAPSAPLSAVVYSSPAQHPVLAVEHSQVLTKAAHVASHLSFHVLLLTLARPTDMRVGSMGARPPGHRPPPLTWSWARHSASLGTGKSKHTYTINENMSGEQLAGAGHTVGTESMPAVSRPRLHVHQVSAESQSLQLTVLLSGLNVSGSFSSSL